MKVLFIYPNIGTMNKPHFPFSIGMLSAYLKAHGHEIELFFLQEDMPENELLARTGDYDPHLIAFSTVTHQWHYTRKYAAVIKKVFQVPIICGGAHPTHMPEEVIADPNINMVCIGEGEYAMLDVLERMESGGDLSSIPNVWVKNEEGRVFKNPLRDLVQDLDTLPFADRSIIDFQELIDTCNTEPVVMSSRGCPFNCTFCSNSAIKKLYLHKGSWVRQRSPEHVIQEIREMREKYTFDTLNFYDECFGYNHGWLKKFCDMYKSEFGYPFGCFIRAETMDRETFHMLREAGLTIIYIGVESGNEKLRREVMNRKVTNERIIQACRDAQAEGIQVWTYNIVGIPGETVETIEESMEINRIINPNFVCVSTFQPLPGTRLYDVCLENKYIKKDYGSTFYTDPIVELPTISSEDLARKYHEFQELSNEIRLAHEARGDRIFLVDI